MMRWGKQKASSMFPVSWLSSKFFKQMKGGSSEGMFAGAEKKGQLLQQFPSVLSGKEGRFYSGDDESYWRLSFGDEQAAENEDMKKSGREESTKIKQPNAGFSPQNYGWRMNKGRYGAEAKRARRKPVKVQDFRIWRPRPLQDEHSGREFSEDDEEKARKADERVMFEGQQERMAHSGVEFCLPRTSNSQEQCRFSFPNSKLWMMEEEEEEMSLQQRKSVYRNRDCRRRRRKFGRKTKSCSPGSCPAKIECKIKALEDMKKVKKMNMKENQGRGAALGDLATFESYAVIKNSHNPRQDFRDSMIEMIMENGIWRTEELEELLACYLSLNYDECHDLIVKVFREIWLELNDLYLASSDSLNNNRFHDY